MAEPQTFNFTVARLARLAPPASGETQLKDAGCPGLSIRLRSTGGASFVVRYVVTGSGSRTARRYVIGPVGKTGLDEARRVASAIVAAARDGRDPMAEREAKAKQAVAAKERGITLGELLERHEADQKANGVQSAEIGAKSLRKELAKLLSLPACEVPRARFVEVLKAVKEGSPGHSKPRPGSVSTIQARIHGLLAFGENAGLIPANVMAGYRARRGSKKAQNLRKARSTNPLATMAELATIWWACGSLRVRPAFGAYVRALIVTGARRDEMAKAERSWLHAATPETPAHIVIPGEHTKNGREHFLPLPPLALAALAKSPQVSGVRLLFPGGLSRKTGKVAKISGWSKTWPALLKEAEKFGLSRHVTLHDLRRAVRSHYARLGIPDAVAKAQLNHTTTDRLEAAYNRHDLKSERVAAAERWCAEIEAALAGSERRGDEAPSAEIVSLKKPTPARRAGARA